VSEGRRGRGRRALRARADAAQSGCVSLIPLDTKTLRAAALRTLRKAEEAFAEDDRALAAFEKEDVPAFERWKHVRLGPQLAEVARLGEALNEAEYHIAMAHEERWRTGRPLWQAFQLWQKREELRRLRPDPPEPQPPFDDEQDLLDAMKQALKDSPLGDLAEDLGIDLDDLSFEDMDTWDEPPREGRRAGPTSPRDAELKSDLRDRYRRLCRLLHPDAVGDMTPERREIWHQVQEAYAAHDAARLDTLLARVERSAGVGIAPRTIAELRAMALHFRRARRKLRQVLAEARRHPAWQFVRRDEDGRGRLEREISRGIANTLQEMKGRLEWIRRALQAPARQKRPLVYQPDQTELPF
jgi:hypothetical protein